MSRGKVPGFVPLANMQKTAAEMIIHITEKKCNTCGITKPKEEFTVSRNYSDNRVGDCKACLRIKNKKKRDAKKNDPWNTNQLV